MNVDLTIGQTTKKLIFDRHVIDLFNVYDFSRN